MKTKALNSKSSRSHFGVSNLIGVSAVVTSARAIGSLPNRLRRARPGSVLIIVIVLLLLLAILGTAYISTTRSSRVASAENVMNADVDTMINGTAKMCEGVILDDLNDVFNNLQGNTAYQPTGAVANPTVNRSLYQGEGQGVAGAPVVTPEAASYNVGDIVNTTDYPYLYYYYFNTTNGTGFTVGGSTPNITPTAPNANGSAINGWQLLNGHLPITATGADPWLAARIPGLSTTGTPLWTSVTQTVGFNSAGAPAPFSIIGTPFEDPTTALPPPAMSTPLVGLPLGSGNPLTPTYEQLTATGTIVPAFQYGAGTPFVAGDADGDGVADCLLFRLPGVGLNGLTWYCGVRIIDNNSAINANSAWSRDADILTAGAQTNYWNLFSTSVGLRELANNNDLSASPFLATDITALNHYRFQGLTAAQVNPYDESLTNGNWQSPTYVQAYPRPDFNFIGQGDAFYNQFVRRMANPGYGVAPTPNVPLAGRYQAIPLADEAALVYHFCLVNPEETISQAPASLLESLLPYSLFYSAPAIGTTPAKYYRSTPYGSATNDATTWFNDNFNYDNPTVSANGFQSLRPLLVAHNPVSNAIPEVYNNNDNSVTYLVNNYSEGKAYTSDPILPNYMLPYSGASNLHYRGVWTATPATPYLQNDIVVYPGPVTAGVPWNGPSYTFIALTATPAGFPCSLNTTTGVLQPPTPTQAANWQLQPWSLTPTKTNVNTATFRELFRAFWCVMAGNPSNATPFGYTTDPAAGIYDNTTANPQYEFRSPLRDPNSAVPGTASELDGPATTQPNKNPNINPPSGAPTNTNTNTMLLRAAIAAVNTLGLRDNSQNVISKTIVLKNAFISPAGGGAPVPTDVEVRVYSNAPQPFISEVYANANTATTANGQNPAGYVAIELFNPYSVPITMKNWLLAYVNRQPTSSGGSYPNMQPTVIGNIGTTTPVITIPPSGYVLIENYKYAGAPTTQADPNAATYRPPDSNITPTGTGAGTWVPTTPSTQPSTTGSNMFQDIYMPFLEDVIQTAPTPSGGASTGGEFVLLRPRRADGTITSYQDPANANAAGSETFNEANPADLVPVDSYDFSGMQIQPAATPYQLWSYVRKKGNGGVGNQFLFQTTYPGKYNAVTAPREAGTFAQSLTGAATPTYGPTSTPPSTQPAFGNPDSGDPSLLNNYPPVQVYNVGPIQEGTNTLSAHFPNPMYAPNTSSTTNPNQTLTAAQPFFHPFGGFARNGDMLDIPFIGAYRIRVTDATDTLLPYGPNSFVEMNSLPMDCALAAVETGAAANDIAENIGRFVPMAAHTPGYTGPDFYAWTRNLFNYLTVQSPNDTYLPNVDPGFYTSLNYSAASPSAWQYMYPGQNAAPAYPPTPTLTADGTATDQTKQSNVGVEGLININTASWKVLSALPFVQNNAAADETIAKAIVLYRDGDGTSANLPHGPFASIFDLNQVAVFQNGAGTVTISPTVSNASSELGLLSPADAAFGSSSPNSNNPLQGTEDYQTDCLTLTRISNLVTTRSDTFTVYVEVQGWQNVGVFNSSLQSLAQPMITRRYAFIVDRSAVNADPNSRYLKTLTVPND